MAMVYRSNYHRGELNYKGIPMGSWQGMNVRMGWCPVIFQVVCMSTAFITVLEIRRFSARNWPIYAVDCLWTLVIVMQ